MRLIAYDLESGEKAGEVELPEVLIGSRQTDQTVNDQPVWAFLEPAVELSPDGRQLAVVHADAAKVTLLEAQTLTVERTLALKHSTGLLDHFAPAVAHAKGPSEGTIRQAVFSPDGQYLYIFSQEFWVNQEDAPTERGLWLVDLTQGNIVAEALPEYQIQWVRPAPDGSVYVFGTTDERMAPYEIRSTSPSILGRLDALTLEPLAQREFTGYQSGWLVLAQPSK
jgi:dipeptidyl aminopeptidase/acylaminoacyl peptidase